MKRITLALYLVVLCLSLGLAWITWTATPGKPGEQVTVLECGKGDLQKVVLREKDRTVTFSRRTGSWSDRAFWWVEASREPFSPSEDATGSQAPETAAPSAPGGAAESVVKETAAEQAHASPAPDQAAPAGAAATPIVVETFKGNENLTGLLENFCPWKALRRLGPIAAEKQEEFGLRGAGDFLELTFSFGVYRFLLGEASFGPKDRYILDQKTGEVFLVEGQSIKDLLYPKSRFMERTLQAFKKEEVRSLRVSSGGREKELLHMAAAGKGPEEGWADSLDPGQEKDIYGNWIRKVFNLRPIEYLVPAASQGAGASGCVAPEGAETVVTLTFYGEKNEIGFLTLFRKTDEKGAPDFYACSENTGTLVKVSKTQTENVLKDMEDVLSEP